jgi:hypothetical protein
MKSRMFGFGFDLSSDELKQVNDKRRERGNTYSGYAAQAANFLYGDAKKEDLKESPFVRTISYGNHKDGYWTSNHMLVQVEDVLDVWTTLERTKYIAPCMEFDHSSGHDSEREDGLSVSPTNLKMNWGKGRMMRDCELTEGCLGTIEHEDRVYAGETYQHYFKAGHPPKFHDGTNVPAEADAIVETNAKRVQKRKSELILDLEAGGYNSKGRVDDLKARCRGAGIPLEKLVDKTIPGYVGKPKGALDIAYELGWIDASKRNEEGRIVSWNGAILRDAAGAEQPAQQQRRRRGNRRPPKPRDLSTSLRHILGNCDHFKNEKTKLECLIESHGGYCRMTPKCHPEIAGCGIEYDWGYAKLTYRKKINDGVAANLAENVKKALSTVDVLTINRTRKFARKARDYKLTYLFLIRMTDSALAMTGEDGRVAMQAIEHIVKAFKVHRCALDSDYAFIANS